ncbi:hypothetical protein FE257_008078 [Aspergillus nanangensis]|uniref:Thiaminase-2/PQQC domain-containing protein n=1 Tax=Aspergillus nanangensis TaxID=2582783 RepID=A0AAD4CMB0_ASPNN|nr:hypothetical protein FE257_008078 [Aspergillus nanangensis]
MPPKLTTHLPTTTSPTTATTHPFLSAAGKGQIPLSTLSQWLSQDRLYAQSYVRFIGHLLSKIQLSPAVNKNNPLPQRIVSVLIGAVVNIQRELEFFEDVAAEYGIDLNAGMIEGRPTSTSTSTSTSTETTGPGTGKEQPFGPNPVTHAYIDMFMSAGSPATSILEGMVVLWATEECYLRAWRYAGSFMQPNTTGEDYAQDADGGALRKQFIPNWSSGEFEEFVTGIGELVDEMAEGDGIDGEMRAKCERWWRQVVWLEERFWPNIN